MRRVLVGLAVFAGLALSACGPKATNPPEGCRGHGGVAGDPGAIDRGDATNSEKVIACKDGTLVHVHYN